MRCSTPPTPFTGHLHSTASSCECIFSHTCLCYPLLKAWWGRIYVNLHNAVAVCGAF